MSPNFDAHYDQPHLGHFSSAGEIIVWQEGHSRKSLRSDSFSAGRMLLHLGHSFCFHSSYETGPWHLGQRYDIKSRTRKAVTGRKMPPTAQPNALRFFLAAKAPVMAAETAQTATYPIRVPDTDDELFMVLYQSCLSLL